MDVPPPFIEWPHIRWQWSIDGGFIVDMLQDLLGRSQWSLSKNPVHSRPNGSLTAWPPSAYRESTDQRSFYHRGDNPRNSQPKLEPDTIVDFASLKTQLTPNLNSQFLESLQVLITIIFLYHFTCTSERYPLSSSWAQSFLHILRLAVTIP